MIVDTLPLGFFDHYVASLQMVTFVLETLSGSYGWNASSVLLISTLFINCDLLLYSLKYVSTVCLTRSHTNINIFLFGLNYYTPRNGVVNLNFWYCRIFAGYNKSIRVFDIHRPGRDFVQYSTLQGNKEGQAGIIHGLLT